MIKINGMLKSSWLSIVLAAFAMEFVGAVPLQYAPAPSDNPLRGLVPYASASGKDRFPHSMEFRYFSLRELMTGANEFNWEPIESSLEKARKSGNHLILRIYCEYPRKEVAVPQFLIDAGVKITKWSSENSVVSYTPDYENAKLRDALTSFIRAMGAKYDGDPRLAFITAGLLGSWGEWHLYPRNDLWASKEVQREVMDAYTKAFPKTKILLRYPAGEEDNRLAENSERAFGYHDDSFCWSTIDLDDEKKTWYFEPTLRAAGAAEKWKRYPIGGEIRPELWKQSFTSDRHPRDQGFISCVERTHASWLMDSGVFSSNIPMDEERKLTALKETARLGYELHISEAEWSGGTLTLTVENRGVAPFYYDWPVEISVNGKLRKTDWKLSEVLPDEPRKWSIQTAEKSEVRVRIPNPMKGGKLVRFANQSQGEEWLVIAP